MRVAPISEVEGSDGVHKALQRMILHLVPGPSGLLSWLVSVVLPGFLHVITEEVDSLTGCLDLGLPDVLALTKHRRSNNVEPIFVCNEF